MTNFDFGQASGSGAEGDSGLALTFTSFQLYSIILELEEMKSIIQQIAEVESAGENKSAD